MRLKGISDSGFQRIARRNTANDGEKMMGDRSERSVWNTLQEMVAADSEYISSSDPLMGKVNWVIATPYEEIEDDFMGMYWAVDQLLEELKAAKIPDPTDPTGYKIFD